MRLAVFGSRSLSGPMVEAAIMDAIAEHKADSIVTAGEPAGVCQTGRDLARAIPLRLILHFLNPKRGRGAFDHRSRAVLKDCDHLLLLHDGESPGTAGERRLAVRMEVPHTYRILEVLAAPATEAAREAKTPARADGWSI